MDSSKEHEERDNMVSLFLSVTGASHESVCILPTGRDSSPNATNDDKHRPPATLTQQTGTFRRRSTGS